MSSRPQLPLNALRAFEASARHLSFTKAGLERLDMVADRGLADAQLQPGAGEAQVAGRGFEGAKGVEGKLRAGRHEFS